MSTGTMVPVLGVFRFYIVIHILNNHLQRICIHLIDPTQLYLEVSDLVFQYLSRGNNMIASTTSSVQTLFDFTRTDQVGNWIECSDTIKTTGMSKAVFIIQKTQLIQRAIFFTLFNPRPNKSGFAAVRCDTNFDLSDYHYIIIKCRGQGINFKYKMLLRHKELEKSTVVFGQTFTAPENEFGIIKLPLADFKPYYRGQELLQDDNPLDTTAITNIGLKVDMSPYLPENQAGVAALEIDWIKAIK